MSAASVEDHAAHVRHLLDPLKTRTAESVLLSDALGRVAYADVASPVDLPLFRNSQMDGYAVHSSAITTVPVTLEVAGTVAAGATGPSAVQPGTSVKIMTGAPVPEGADTIVPVEHTTAGDEHSVTIEVSRQPGDYIREQGSDVIAGTTLIHAGQLLEPRHIAVLAAVGLSHTQVRSRPRVAVITTGAELVEAGSSLRLGQIFDSNGIALASHLRSNGAEVTGVHRSSDEPADFYRIVTAAAAESELVITSGGVSMGDFEVVKDVLLPLGGQFGPVRMQPGGPQGTAVVDGVPVLNFPGNPVSTVVSFLVFARDVLREAAGLPPVPTRVAKLAADVTSVAGKRQFLRGKLEGETVTLIAGAGSHLVAAMAWADVLVDVPVEVTEMTAGSEVTVVPL